MKRLLALSLFSTFNFYASLPHLITIRASYNQWPHGRKNIAVDVSSDTSVAEQKKILIQEAKKTILPLKDIPESDLVCALSRNGALCLDGMYTDKEFIQVSHVPNIEFGADYISITPKNS